MLYCYGNIGINLVPKQSSLIFWNLNGIAAHDFTKTSLLQGYITERNFHIICLSEAFLNSSLDSEDDRLKIEGYDLISTDHTNGSKKEAFAVTIRNIFLLLEEMISVL